MNQNQNEILPNEQPASLFQQVDQQVADGQLATVLVERSNGDITTAQVEGVTEGQTIANFGDVRGGLKDDTPAKLVPNERLTDKYQEHLAEKLAGIALKSEMENDFYVLLTGDDERVATPQVKQRARAEVQQNAEWEAGRAERERTAADHKYNQALLAGATPEEAEKSANRAYRNQA